MREAESAEPFEAVARALEHRDGGRAPGHEAARRVHGHRLESPRETPGARIEDMAVAHAVDLDVALVVAAGGDRAGGHGQRGEQLVRAARMLDPHAPWQ